MYVRSIESSTRGIDKYFVDDMEVGKELLYLDFRYNGRYLTNKKMNGLDYEEVYYNDFSALTQESFPYQNPSMLLTFEDGLITEAVLENYYGSGISYDTMYPDTWYEDIQDITSLDAKEVLDTYYTLESTEEMDIGDGDGVGFIMTMHIEDRDDFGVYSYHVFRLDDNGDKKLIAGSSFNWGDGIRYEDELFHEWADEMSGYLEDSRLMLSTQEGELNTEHVSEAYKYNYRTLR